MGPAPVRIIVGVLTDTTTVLRAQGLEATAI
jgi:hypothetical protein